MSARSLESYAPARSSSARLTEAELFRAYGVELEDDEA